MNPKAGIFPYQKNPNGQFFPVIQFSIISQKKKLDISALIDSGATISIFKQDVANSLGIKIEDGKEIILGGVGGRIKGYLHKVKIEVAGQILTIQVVFSYEYLVSLNLLGRDSFFEKFRICFDEKAKKIILE